MAFIEFKIFIHGSIQTLELSRQSTALILRSAKERQSV